MYAYPLKRCCQPELLGLIETAALLNSHIPLRAKTAPSSPRQPPQSHCFSAQGMHHLRCSFHSTTITPPTSRERKTSLRLTMSQRNSSTPHQRHQIGCAATAQLHLKYGKCQHHYPAPKTGCWAWERGNGEGGGV